MAKESARLRGVVVQFNHQKGYGFIKPNNGGDNLFVHYSDVKTESFRTLHKDLSVEFTVQTDGVNNKKKAVEVTGINGSQIKIVLKSVSRGSGRDSDGQLVGIGDCYNSGQHGHMARNYRNISWCYTCCKYGHNTKGCTYAKSIGDGASYNCYNYGGSGHFSRDCTHVKSGGYAKSGGDGASYKCYNCGGSGHFARDCTSARSNRGGACYNCGEQGHLAREYPKGASNGGSGGAGYGGGRRGATICFNCSEEGHFAKDCQKA
ncbi:Cold shock domain-containing protein 4 [Heracleum sosnowskyi]|uniref:Cold shock domain-containing protein 4 n=1 Tax=Heracleum sosnowskyi TaxID=360622 RepID=A0AAD8HCD6_9APIA|nr:Cold shock domain-containing protein 4 [Heracleum sosnowskyi]